jgi:hypothetical protein
MMARMSISFSESKISKCNSKKSDTITECVSGPVFSPEVKRWRNSSRNAAFFDAFDSVIEELNKVENRLAETKSDGYDYRLKACHKHIAKKVAVFYEYTKTEFRVFAVMKHFNDNNRWKLI